MTIDQSQSAEAFRQLHVPGTPLVVANAWDAASAAAFQAAGFAAIATTSGGVAWANGVPDGNRISAETLLGGVEQILAAVELPLSVDIEGGLSLETAPVATLVGELSQRGVAGVNLEDSWDGGLVPVDVQRERIAAVRAVSSSLFVNARIDTFFFGSGGDRDRLEETVARAATFVEAGADGIFVPGLAAIELIRDLASRVSVPVNIMTGPGGLTVEDLASAGVARVSFGTALAEAAYSRAQDLAVQLRDSEPLPAVELSLSYPVLNDLLTR